MRPVSSIRRLYTTSARPVILLYSVFIYCSALYAVGQDQCRDVLLKTEVNRVDTLDKKMAYLWTIQTEDEFNDSTKAGGALKAIISEIPFEATANFDAFKSWRSTLSQQVNWDLHLEEDHRLVTTFVPDNASDDWLKCMQIDTGGLEISAFDIQPDIVRVVVSWVQPYEGNRPTKFNIPRPTVVPPISPIGGWQDLPAKNVETKRNWQFFFKRSKTQDLRVAMSLGAWKPSLFVPRTPIYSNSCTRPFGDLFKGVPAGPNGWSISCAGFEPGTKVTVSLADALFKVDQAGAIWISLRASLAGGQVNIPTHDLLYIRFWGDPPTPDDSPKPWSFSNMVTVPWDGIIEATIFVDRAETLPGINHSLSATQGTFVVVKVH